MYHARKQQKKYDKEKKLIKYIHSPPGRERRGGEEEKEKDSHAADEKN